MEEKTIQLQLDEATAQGSYANIAMLTSSENEFIIDFAFYQNGQPHAKINNRVIMHPRQAKRLAVTLSNTLSEYEKNFGVLEL